MLIIWPICLRNSIVNRSFGQIYRYIKTMLYALIWRFPWPRRATICRMFIIHLKVCCSIWINSNIIEIELESFFIFWKIKCIIFSKFSITWLIHPWITRSLNYFFILYSCLKGTKTTKILKRKICTYFLIGSIEY